MNVCDVRNYKCPCHQFITLMDSNFSTCQVFHDQERSFLLQQLSYLVVLPDVLVISLVISFSVEYQCVHVSFLRGINILRYLWRYAIRVMREPFHLLDI